MKFLLLLALIFTSCNKSEESIEVLPFNTCVEVTSGFYKGLKGTIKDVVPFSSSYLVNVWDEPDGIWREVNVYYKNVSETTCEK